MTEKFIAEDNESGWFVVSPGGFALSGPHKTEAQAKSAVAEKAAWIQDDIKVTVKYGIEDGFKFKPMKQEETSFIDFLMVSESKLGQLLQSPMNEAKLVKTGGFNDDDASFGFESRKNAIATDKALTAAGITFKRNSNFGIHYFHFETISAMKKAVKIARSVIDKSEESEWR